MKNQILFFYFFILSLLFLNTGCKKIQGLSKGNLSFSLDTIVFDTVFTTIGSTTKQFKIYNNDNKTVSIDEIELMGGTNSPFKLNLDGTAGKIFSNVKIEGRDSLFTFLEVKLKVNNQTNPMVIRDSIRFRTNGKDQYIQLVVWGQDMYYHYSRLTPGKQEFDLNEGTWSNDKPHLIYGAAFIDEGKTLNIQAGTKVYLHKNALLYNYKGSLNINGELNNEVIFQGDRLESEYDNISGQYYGIYFDSARPSSINYAIIKNGTTGIHLFSNNETNTNIYTLKVTNTKIYNNISNGILIYSGASVFAENCVISQNGGFGLLVLLGGDFNLNHCDILGYNSASKNQAVGIINHFNINGVTNVGSIYQGIIRNSVIYGNLTAEIAFDTINMAGVTLNFDIQRCLIKKETIGTDPFYKNGNIWNNDPLFNNISKQKFTFVNASPLKGSADDNFPTLTGKTIEGLNFSPSNIGAY